MAGVSRKRETRAARPGILLAVRVFFSRYTGNSLPVLGNARWTPVPGPNSYQKPAERTAPAPSPAPTPTFTPKPAAAGPVTRPNGQVYQPRALAGRPDVEVLRTLRADSVPTLLEGPPGTGKTS